MDRPPVVRDAVDRGLAGDRWVFRAAVWDICCANATVQHNPSVIVRKWIRRDCADLLELELPARISPPLAHRAHGKRNGALVAFECLNLGRKYHHW